MEWFHAPEVHQRELRTVFRRGWQYVGTADRVAEPGSYFTSWIAQTPVVVTRDGAGVLRAFANVCPHRGHAVADGEGSRGTLQCRYHGWTFGLNGALRAAPRTDEDPTFDRSGVSLCEFAVDTWGPLVFACADPALSFAEATAGIRAAAARRGFDPEMHPRRASRAFELKCNWKVTLDNNSECYHCATIHRSFATDYYVDREHYLMETFEQSFTHQAPMKRGASNGPAPDFHLYYVWPNFMLSARRREYFYVYHYRPIGPNRTLQVNDYFFPPDWTSERIDEEIDEILVIMREDWAAFESCQQGIESGVFESGIVLPHEEALLCHFQTMHARVLGS